MFRSNAAESKNMLNSQRPQLPLLQVAAAAIAAVVRAVRAAARRMTWRPARIIFGPPILSGFRQDARPPALPGQDARP